MTSMRILWFRPNRFARTSRRQDHAFGGFKILLLAAAFTGLVLGGALYWRRSSAPPDATGNEPASSLSASTREVLGRLEAPVEIRLYALLDPASVPEAVGEFAGRASQLLAEYESESGGKIAVHRFDSMSDADAASADGIQPFNQNQGEPCFLGIAILCNGRRESLPRLAPEWELALEADLSRALARAAQAGPEPRTLTKPSAEDQAAIEAVKQAIPNLDRVSVEEGAQTLRLQALAESRAYAQETEARIKEIELRLGQARQSGSEADQQAALRDLQQLQAGKLAKLQEIAAQTQARVEALKQLKKEGN